MADEKPLHPSWAKASAAIVFVLAFGEMAARVASAVLSSLVSPGFLSGVLTPALLAVLLLVMMLTGKVNPFRRGGRDFGRGGRALAAAVLLLSGAAAWAGAKNAATSELSDGLVWRAQPEPPCKYGYHASSMTWRVPERLLKSGAPLFARICFDGALTEPSLSHRKGTGEFALEQASESRDCTDVRMTTREKQHEVYACWEGEAPGPRFDSAKSGNDTLPTRSYEELEWYERWFF